MAEILHVGDSVVVAGLGRVTVDRIDVCLRPSTDPGAEEHAVQVDSIELGEHGPPFVIDVEGGGWAYGSQVTTLGIERGES